MEYQKRPMSTRKRMYWKHGRIVRWHRQVIMDREVGLFLICRSTSSRETSTGPPRKPPMRLNLVGGIGRPHRE